MKIVMLSMDFPPDVWGGLEAGVYYLARGLTQLPKIRLMLYCFHKKNEILREKYKGIQVVRLPESMKHKPSTYAHMIVKENPGYDVLHIHHSFFLLDVALLLKSRFPERPLIYTSHSILRRDQDLSPKLLGKHWHKYCDYYYWAWNGQERLFKHADYIIFASEKEKVNFCYDYPFLRHKAVMIPHGYEFSAKSGKKRTIKKPFQILYIGRFVYHKGLDYLFEALQKLPKESFSFTICGGHGFSEYLQVVEKKIQNLKKTGISIKHIDWTDFHTKHKLYQKADMLVVPSLYEPFGFVAIEALDNGLPVLYSKYGGFDKIDKYGIGELIDAKDPKDVASKIMKVIADHSDYREKIAHAKTRLAKIHNPKSIARSTLNLYEKVSQTQSKKDKNILQGLVRRYRDNDTILLHHTDTNNLLAINPIVSELIDKKKLNGHLPPHVLKYNQKLAKEIVRILKSYEDQKKSPKVSVMVPVHNREKFIRNCLDSILSQTFQDFEIVIFDDASTDKTPDICKGYAKKYKDKIFYYRSNKKLSVGRARNKALKKCRGKYIAICDSDDMFLKYRFESQVSALDSDNRLGLVCADAIIVNEKGVPTGDSLYMRTTNELTYENLKKISWDIHQPTVMMRKDAVLRVGGYRDLKVSEDNDLFVRIAKFYKIRHDQRFYTFYRSHEKKTSNIYSDHIKKTDTEISKNVKEWEIKEGISL